MQYTIEHDENGKIKAINAYYGPAQVKALCWTMVMEPWGTSIKHTMHPMTDSEQSRRHMMDFRAMFESAWDREHLGE